MRRLATADRIRRLLRELGRVTREPATVYLTGGATAVLHGWRDATIDVDVKLVPERDELLRAIQRLRGRADRPAREHRTARDLPREPRPTSEASRRH